MRDTLAEMHPLMTGWLELEGHLRRTLAWLPAPVVEFRVRTMRESAVSGLASIEAMVEHDDAARAELPVQIGMLVDANVAMLGGPVSPEVMRIAAGTGRAYPG
jgi:hypothetical protein